MNKLLYEDLTYKIIGAAKEVYKELGPGFLPAWLHHSDRESVYERELL